MDSFAKRYLIVLTTIIIVGIAWISFGGDKRVSELNRMLAADEKLAVYPYEFRVRRIEDGVAVMGSPRSAEVPVMQFLRAAFPTLSQSAVDDPAMMEAQNTLAETQGHAQRLVADQVDIQAVRWEFDEDWYRRKGVFLEF
jgi:hypothetical protein